MSELIQLILYHLRGMWNRRWIGLAAAWLAAIIGVAIVLRIPEHYEANARLFIDTQSLLRPALAGLSIQPNLEQQVALVSRTLITRPTVEKVVVRALVEPQAQPPAGIGELVNMVMGSLQITGERAPPGQPNYFYNIAYRDIDRERAKQVVQALIEVFIESSVGNKRDDTQNALQFLDEQIEHYDESLKAAENRLKEFKLKYMGIAGQGGQAGQDFFGRISRLSDDIVRTKLELSSAIQTRDSYRQALAGESATVTIDQRPTGVPAPVPEIDQRIAAQRAKLDELLRAYTDRHPDVVGTRRVLVELEEQRKAEMKERATQPNKSTQVSEQNPVFQQIRVSLANAEANVASLNAKLASFEGQYRELKASAQLVPQVEAEYAQLTRDYEIQKKTYGDLLARRQAAAMGAEVQETEAAMFRVIDPPRASSQPVPPTRLTLLGMAFAAALGAGLLASFFANGIRPTFHDARGLRAVSERPLLGTLSLWPTQAMLRKKRLRLALFVSGVAGLAVSFAGIVAFSFLLAHAA